MISFLNDYSEGCHPRILEALARHNEAQALGYSGDAWTAEASDLIRAACGYSQAAIRFLAGGTLTNIVGISACLGAHQAVMAPDCGHIVRHESGAIEAAGHRVILVPSQQGKLNPEAVQAVRDRNLMAPHMAQPRILYISQATELGTVYTKAEMEALAEYCRRHSMLLFVDGARLGNAVVAGDLSLNDLGELADVFWIGGTKNGALLGEALVVPNPQLAPGLAYIQKQRGGLMAKGRVMGLSFIELFRDGLFEELATHANAMAKALATGLESAGHALAVPCETNQVFVNLPDALVESLEQHFAFHRWEQSCEGTTTLRLVTSWATPQEHVESLLRSVRASGVRV